MNPSAPCDLTSAPRLHSSSTIALPIPLVPPVTRHRLPISPNLLRAACATCEEDAAADVHAGSAIVLLEAVRVFGNT